MLNDGVAGFYASLASTLDNEGTFRIIFRDPRLELSTREEWEAFLESLVMDGGVLQDALNKKAYGLIEREIYQMSVAE